MTITAKIIADSISNEGKRLTTLQLRYPRFIHSEFLTHKKISRNASSSRAIPVTRMIEDLRRDPAMPVYWGSNKPGMQASEELSEIDIELCKGAWLQAMEDCIRHAEFMIEIGLHKQISNRLLEPWAHMNTLATATCWTNTFLLRRHPDAQPEFKALADTIHEAMEASEPMLLQPGQWHLPYITPEDKDVIWNSIGELSHKVFYEGKDFGLHIAKLVSVARCARVSYLTHDMKASTIEQDLELAMRLIGSSPLHASPAEHQATPDTKELDYYGAQFREWENQDLHGNLSGWIQYRKTLPGEFIPG